MRHDSAGSPQFPHGCPHLVFPGRFPGHNLLWRASVFRAFLRLACPTIEGSEVLAEERSYAKDEKSVGTGVWPGPVSADSADPAQSHAAAQAFCTGGPAGAGREHPAVRRFAAADRPQGGRCVRAGGGRAPPARSAAGRTDGGPRACLRTWTRRRPGCWRWWKICSGAIWITSRRPRACKSSCSSTI